MSVGRVVVPAYQTTTRALVQARRGNLGVMTSSLLTCE